MRALLASSSRSLAVTSPLISPLTTMCGACTSPMTLACSDKVSIACAPSPRIAPSILPSMCSRPVNRMSPRISVPAAISVVVSAPGRASARLVLNIGNLRGVGAGLGERVGPGEFLLGATHVAAGVGLDPDAIGREAFRQHQGAAHLLEVLERERHAGAVLVRRELAPGERGELAAAHAVDAEPHPTRGDLPGFQRLGQGDGEIVYARRAAGLQMHAVHVQALELAGVGEPAVEGEVRAQRGALLVAIAQTLLHVGIGRARHLFGALEYGDALAQRLALLLRPGQFRAQAEIAGLVLQRERQRERE